MVRTLDILRCECLQHCLLYIFLWGKTRLPGGVRVGLLRQDALKLAAQTVKGAAEMVLSTGLSPAVLKDQGTLSYCASLKLRSLNQPLPYSL